MISGRWVSVMIEALRHVEEMMAERGLFFDPATVHR
jgi:transposase-like protein